MFHACAKEGEKVKKTETFYNLLKLASFVCETVIFFKIGKTQINT